MILVYCFAAAHTGEGKEASVSRVVFLLSFRPEQQGSCLVLLCTAMAVKQAGAGAEVCSEGKAPTTPSGLQQIKLDTIISSGCS